MTKVTVVTVEELRKRLDALSEKPDVRAYLWTKLALDLVTKPRLDGEK